jgi:hypothetical protein
MKKVLLVCVAVVLLVALAAVPVFAKGPSGPAGKSDVGHINLVVKDNLGPDGIPNTGDETWAILSYEGKLTYQVDGTTVHVVLNARELVPGNWYYAELVDVSAGWTPVNETGAGQPGDNDCYAMFYAQANGGGNIHMSFTTNMSISSGMLLEVGIKNAEWAALLSPSTPGIVAQWVGPTGQGWTHVLWSEAATIAIP